ncbi:MAG TPA: hypothetical protein PLH38_05345 [Clostridia bacterium]|nr:hypothetical protein [Clostridia bacterium]
MASRIDIEIRRILDAQYNRAAQCIEEDLDALDRVAKALVEHERLDGDTFAKLYRGEPVEINGSDKSQEPLPESGVLDTSDDTPLTEDA